MTQLRDKVVVITGAGSGIGRALAVALAREGAHLALSDVDDVGLKETAELVAGTQPRGGTPSVRVELDVVDVSDREAMARYANRVVDIFGRVNVVINNAGVALHGEVEAVDYADIEWIMAINFWGVVHGSKEFLPHLIASGDGHLVNVSSLFGIMAVPGQSAYNASKFAVRGFTEALRQEMIEAGQPVRVTCIHPGGIKTGIARNARTAGRHNKEKLAATFDEKLAKTSPERAAEIIVGGIRKNRARVLVGRDAEVFDVVVRLLGSRYQGVMSRLSRLGR